MGELTVREEAAAAVTEQASGPVSALAQWAFDADQAYQIATKLAGTSFVPASMRGKAGDVTAAILTGVELGLRPMASLRAMDVIKGTPALRAHAMRGLVQSHGHEVEQVESTETRCVMRGRRKGSETWQEVTWTIERAKRLELTSREQWQKQPTSMLSARATGEICRLIAADVLYAAPYVAEELDGDARPTPTYSAAPVTAGEILGEDEPDAGEELPEAGPPPGEQDPDEEAAAQLADETGGWPPVRKPGSGA
jgi:hypothetical protein